MRGHRCGRGSSAVRRGFVDFLHGPGEHSAQVPGEAPQACVDGRGAHRGAVRRRARRQAEPRSRWGTPAHAPAPTAATQPVGDPSARTGSHGSHTHCSHLSATRSATPLTENHSRESFPGAPNQELIGVREREELSSSSSRMKSVPPCHAFAACPPTLPSLVLAHRPVSWGCWPIREAGSFS